MYDRTFKQTEKATFYLRGGFFFFFLTPRVKMKLGLGISPTMTLLLSIFAQIAAQMRT